MSLTQKYKQTQQQVRIQTSESNYLRGMYYTDVPLAEGYSKTLINFDIDTLNGKLIPRRGLQSLGLIHPAEDAKQYLNNTQGYNVLARTKVCASSDAIDKRKINRILQSILYNTDTRALSVLSCGPEITENNKFKVTPFTLNSSAEFVTPEPFIIAQPQIHGKRCIRNDFFKRPVGTFAFGNSYYTFLKRAKYTVHKITDLPVDSGQYANIPTYAVLAESAYATGGTPGQYFKFVSGVSMGTLAYYDTDGNIALWERSEEALQQEIFPSDEDAEALLCYTKLGSEIQSNEILLDESIDRATLESDKYYVCVIDPTKLNPTEASSWGYNMLLKDPYAFVCERTAVNNVTITGIIPYDKDNKPCLTPRKNQEITLKGFYRAPAAFHSDTEQPKYYATTKKRIAYYTKTQDIVPYSYKTYYTLSNGVYSIADVTEFATGVDYYEKVYKDPKTLAELKENITVSECEYGDWWYCTVDQKYYMIIPKISTGESNAVKTLDLFGDSKPAASEKLNATNSTAEDPIRIHWQMRSAEASDWIDLHDETITFADYKTRYGELAPFITTVTLPADEVIIKLTITDPTDNTTEERVLSTNTIGISLVSDELANTLNLSANAFPLDKATGMCEWEQRLVLWGVPDALNTLFISDVNNPGFFPYPNNIDTFTDPIISVHNYGNELLVLTTSALYRLIWDAEGTGWVHKLVQQNLHVTLEDTYMSCVIKNMFFFKSGESYYMMVPKTTTISGIRGEVTIAPISKVIDPLLKNFHTEIYNLVSVVLGQSNLMDFTKHLVNYFSYVDNTKVVVNYVYDLNATLGTTESVTNSKYLYVQVIYDTDARTWSIKIFEAPHMLYASHEDAIQQDRFIDITPALNTEKLCLQYYKFINIADNSIQYITEDDTETVATKLMKNYQYLDTGNREINTDMQKRFREFQFKLKNLTQNNLGFYTSFLIDGSLRKDLQKYAPRFILDTDTEEATIIVERVLDTTTMTYNTTRVERIVLPKRMLQDSGELTLATLGQSDDPDKWTLDQSAIKGRTFWKIRMPINGKGYTPRVILLSTNEAEYELLGHSWVYRTMNAR